MHQKIKCRPGKLHELWLLCRVHEIPGLPEVSTHQRQTIHKRWLGFAIPRRYRHRNLPAWVHLQGQHAHEGKQGQQDRRGADNGVVRPLPLGLQPEMCPGLNGHLDRPAPDHPPQDAFRWRLQVGTEEARQTQLPLRIGHQHKADLHRGQAWRVPQDRVREDPQCFALATVPVHLHGLPGGIAAAGPGASCAPAASCVGPNRCWSCAAAARSSPRANPGRWETARPTPAGPRAPGPSASGRPTSGRHRG